MTDHRTPRAKCPKFKARVDWGGQSCIECCGKRLRFESREKRDDQYRIHCCSEWETCRLKDVKTEEEKMTMLAEQENTSVLTLADYEARIHLYKEQIGTGYIGIGRTLNEAKAAGVVPHGEWETWVERTTGLSPRNAQRCMQAAREIKDGSALARLEMTKALMLLSSGLDDESRETVAQQAADESATVKELRERIKAREKGIMELREANQRLSGQIQTFEIKTRHADQENRELQHTCESLHGQIEDMDRCMREIAEEAEKYRGQLEGAHEYMEREKQKAVQAAVDTAKATFTEPYKRRIEDLEEELKAAERREEKRAAELGELRRARLEDTMQDARGVNVSGLGALDVAAAVRSFIGQVGVLPQMTDSLRRLSDAERQTLEEHIETVKRWVLDCIKALVKSEPPISSSGTVQ